MGRMNKIFYMALGCLWSLLIILAVFLLMRYKYELQTEQEDATRNLVEHAYSIVSALEEQVQNRSLPETEAKKIASLLLSKMNNHSRQYIFAVSRSPSLHYVAHGHLPDLVGKPMAQLGHEYIQVGNNIYQQLEKMGGQGFVRYSWFNQGLQQAQHKVSYAMQSRDWNWLIGSGTYPSAWQQFFYHKALWLSLIMLGVGTLLSWLLWLTRHHFLLQLGEDPKRLSFRIRELGKGIFNQSFPSSFYHTKARCLDALEQAQENLSMSVRDVQWHHEALATALTSSRYYLEQIHPLLEQLMSQSQSSSLESQDSTLWLSRLCEHIQHIKLLEVQAKSEHFQSMVGQLEQLHQHLVLRQRQAHQLQQNIQELKESIEQSNMLMMHMHLEAARNPEEIQSSLDALRTLQEQHHPYVQSLFDQVQQMLTSDYPLIQQSHHIQQLAREGQEYAESFQRTLVLYGKNYQEIKTLLSYIEQNLLLYQQKQEGNQQQKETILSILYHLKTQYQHLNQSMLALQQHAGHIQNILHGFVCLESNSFSDDYVLSRSDEAEATKAG
jgi:hypothetical protein